MMGWEADTCHTDELIAVSPAATIELLAHKASVYRVLAHLFKQEVDVDLLDHMQEMHMPSTITGESRAGFGIMLDYVKRSRFDPITELATDYARLFLGAAGSERCASPYESVYTGRDRLMMQNARDAVVAFYKTGGLEVSADCTIPEDHLGLELEFMAHLCKQEENKSARQDNQVPSHPSQLKQTFLAHHLLNWLPDCCQDITRYAHTDFYRGLARAAEGFIRMDLTETTALIDKGRGSRSQHKIR